MDLHLKQWRDQQEESEQQQQQQQQQHPTSAKMPKLIQFEQHQQQHQQQQHPSSGSTTLPLFVPENPNTYSKLTNLSAFSDLSTRFPTSNTRMGSYFSMGQWQELELQAVIYRYMLAGATVPPELLHQIKKSLLQTPPYHFIHHPLAHHLQHYPQYQPSLLHSGYWGRAAMDPEPGRCRRTDGKKWRCSRDVVPGQKYCERHMHRGRNRSRKPVEIPTSTTANGGANGGGDGGGGGAGAGGSTFKTGDVIVATPLTSVSGPGNHFALSGPSPSIDLFQLNQSCYTTDHKTESKTLSHAQREDGSRSDGHILRHFFDDWPRSLQDGSSGDNAGSNASPMNSSTSLSISMPGNASSDVSLKLATGNVDEPSPISGRNAERDHLQMNSWAAGGWSQHMGGPLAEALRSSTSHSSPTSVLHQLPRGSASETSYVTT